MSNSDDLRWAAVRRRDSGVDGQFVYSVASTGVYCRPSCAARLALRRNVAFHESCAAAESAGFRPCKRCRPNEPSLEARHAAVVREACRAIETSDATPDLAALAAAAGLSRFHFLRVFRKVAGVTPGAYAARWRSDRVRSELRAGGSVTEAIYDAGFHSSSRFYEKAPEILGMTAGQFRDGGSGVAIRYAIANSSLGLVLVAGSELGICSVRFGENADALTSELRADFPLASIAPGGPEFEAWTQAVLARIDDPKAPVSQLPLDIRGTAFQHKVWTALRAIPAGETASYTDVAAQIGSPAAVRAVGTACGANPVAVVIPCHRVMRSDGGPGGYRWGLERKRRLLERERD